MEIIKSKEQKEKRLKKSEQSISALWYLCAPISRPIYVLSYSQKEKTERKGAERL